MAARGENVTIHKASENFKKNPHFASVLAKPYAIGARLQLARYQEVRSLHRESGILSVQLCIHEASNLFEDLSAIVAYLECLGITHRNHQLWVDVRHHIRHDLREEFDKEEVRKSARANRLHMTEKLQGEWRFADKTIRIGGVTISLTRIENYLNWADEQLDTLMGVSTTT